MSAADGLREGASRIVETMKARLGTKVTLEPKAGGGGKIVIEYYTSQDLDRIYRQITL